MKTAAVVMQAPEDLVVSSLELDRAGDADLVVDIDYSGISAGSGFHAASCSVAIRCVAGSGRGW